MKILAIESSCDETAAAIYQEGRGIIANVTFTQIELHRSYGGVVPEIASKSHIENIEQVVTQALQECNLQLNDIDYFAVTNKPGLPGSLLIGLCFIKGIATALNKKIIGVNHLDGHINSVLIEHNITFPYLCISASGGHSSLYLVESPLKNILIGHALDDAAGEAFDKISKLMDLGYPGGPIIEQLAKEVNYKDYYSYPRAMSNSLDFSFSGLKTAVLYDLVNKNAYDLETKTFLKKNDINFQMQVASSSLNAISDILCRKIILANKIHYFNAVAFVGGVACNKFIRAQMLNTCNKINKDLFWPSAKYCTDNASMIAITAYYKAKANMFDDLTLDIY